MSFANNGQMFALEEDFDPFALLSHFEPLPQPSNERFDHSSPYMTDPGKATEVPFSIDPRLLNLQCGYPDDPNLKGGILPATPFSNFSGPFDGLKPMNDPATQISADASDAEDISGQRRIFNDTSCANQVPCNKITVTIGGKTIHLDATEATSVFTASGLGMLMDSSEANHPPHISSQLEPVEPMETDTGQNPVDETRLHGSFDDMANQWLPLQSDPEDTAINIYGAEPVQQSYLPMEIDHREARSAHQVGSENYITSLDGTQIELVHQPLSLPMRFENRRERSRPFEPTENVFAEPLESGAYDPSSRPDCYPPIQPKDSPLLLRTTNEVSPRTKR